MVNLSYNNELSLRSNFDESLEVMNTQNLVYDRTDNQLISDTEQARLADPAQRSENANPERLFRLNSSQPLQL